MSAAYTTLHWRWVDPSGVQRLVGFDELRNALAKGTLPPHTLVWRLGMAEWRHAFDVEDLANPPAASNPNDIPPPPAVMLAIQAEFEHGSSRPPNAEPEPEPPPPPLHLYAAYTQPQPPPVEPRPPMSTLSFSRSAAPLPPPPRSKAPPVHSSPASTAPALPNPPGFSPPRPIIVPAPRAILPAAITQSPPFAGEPEALLVPLPPPVPSRGSLGMASSSGPPPETEAFPAFELEDVESETLGQAEPRLVAVPTEDAGSDARSPWLLASRWVERARPLILRHARSSLERAMNLAEFVGEQARARPVVALAVGGAAAMLGILVLLAVLPSKRRPGEQTVASAVIAHSAQSPSLSPMPTTCRMDGRPQRLSTKARKDVPIELRSDRAQRFWVGFGFAPGLARGLAVALDPFSVREEFESSISDALRAVVPIPDSSGVTFVTAADRSTDRLRGWRPLSSEPPRVVGQYEQGIGVAAQPAEEPMLTFPLEGDAPVEAIKVVEASDQGRYIVFRRSGAIWAGRIAADGRAQGELFRVEGAGAPPGSPVGTPAADRSGRVLAVAFADRASGVEPWAIRFAASENIPTKTQVFRPPAGGPGGACTAPALAGLGEGRFVLAWTEGPLGAHAVRAQIVSADLSPIGEPVLLSEPSTDSGQATISLAEGRGLAAYLRMNRNGTSELWGSVLDCR